MMMIPRLLPLAVVVVLLGASSPALEAQNTQQPKPPKRTNEEQRDIQTLVQLIDAVSAGKQPAPTDMKVAWESNHFVKGGDGSTYIPFTLGFDAGQFGMPNAAVYVRVISKAPPAAPAASTERKDQPAPARVVYPWDNVYFADIKSDGKISRPMALKAGEYEVFVAVKEKSIKNPPRNAPPAKLGFLRHDLTVPDYNALDLSTSSVLVASLIEPIAAPLSPEQQLENPYTFGTMRVVPSPNATLKKDAELQVLFWIYGTQQSNGKPDVLVEYNFHQKTAEGEKYFNKTAPQALNAGSLPPQFDIAAGHQLPGSIVVPLASFPAGEYRLEIKITDKVSNKTLTQNAIFIVEA